MDHDAAAALQDYYAQGGELDRLESGLGRVEYARTVEVIRRTLPASPAVVADIGGGPGRYTDWLVDAGYAVVHRDIVEDHVAHVKQRHGDAVDAAVRDACDLDVAGDSVDAVLLLGPLYHLPELADRLQALREATRVVRPGGIVYAAAITRWAARLHGMLVSRVHEMYPEVLDLIDDVERHGWMMPLDEGSFTGFTHTPEQFRDEILDAGLVLESLVCVEGMACALPDIDARMDDDRERAVLLDILRAVESVPDLMGIGPHLLATARFGL